jgi:Fur family ferric uptake transcriptional regulator
MRIRILEVLRESAIPLSAGEVRARLGEQGPDLVTVYRTLERFVGASLLRAVHLDDAVRRFELAERGHHHHLVCTNCGEMSDLDTCVLEPLEARVLEEHGFRVSRHALEFFGTCQRCRPK